MMNEPVKESSAAGPDPLSGNLADLPENSANVGFGVPLRDGEVVWKTSAIAERLGNICGEEFLSALGFEICSGHVL